MCVGSGHGSWCVCLVEVRLVERSSWLICWLEVVVVVGIVGVVGELEGSVVIIRCGRL